MTFSPPDSGRTLTDHKTWRVATLGNGVVQYKESIVDVNHLTRSIENLKTMGSKELSPRTLFRKKSMKAPAGTKCHLYERNGQEYADNYVTKWKQIHGKLGMKRG